MAERPAFTHRLKDDVIGAFLPTLKSVSAHNQYIDGNSQRPQHRAEPNHFVSPAVQDWFDDKKIQIAVLRGVAARVRSKKDYLRPRRRSVQQALNGLIYRFLVNHGTPLTLALCRRIAAGPNGVGRMNPKSQATLRSLKARGC